MLISDFELDEDDREPYLQYAIRESTLYFLSDLVCEFFVKNEIKAVEDIEKQGWYFTEYGLDASIQSIIAAIKIIEEKLPLETVAFGNFSIRAEGLLKEIKARVKGIVENTDLFNLTASNFTASKHLKLWLLLKVLHAEKNDFLLNFYDGNGIATYTIAADNCLNEKLPFSIENSICGYAIKSPTNKVSYADGGNWKSENFDVLLLPDVITHEMFKNREKEPICEENINLLGNYIGELKKMLEDF